MTKDINITNWIRLVAFVFLLTACDMEELIEKPHARSYLDLSASKIQVTTKAPTDPILEVFPTGTIYSVYAHEVNGDKENNLWKGNNPRECKEDENHKIDYTTTEYPEKISLGIKAANFYGLTYGSATSKVEATDYDLQDTHKIKIATDSKGNVQDLMFSNNLKNCNSSQGSLQMNFKHAMSKIKFQIYKDEETGYDDEHKFFLNTKLTKIEIKTCNTATFDVKTGTWSNWEKAEQGKKAIITYYSNAEGLPLKTSVTDITNLNETLIIPNNPKDSVEVVVYLDNVKDSNSSIGQSKTCTYTIRKTVNDHTPFPFQPNHQYNIVIGILRAGGETVIAFEPKVEPWKDLNIDLGETK